MLLQHLVEKQLFDARSERGVLQFVQEKANNFEKNNFTNKKQKKNKYKQKKKLKKLYDLSRT